MVTLNKIYTKTGDKGTTALGSGARVDKNDARICAYGTVDETNSALGLAYQYLRQDAENGSDSPKDLYAQLAEMVLDIQNDLFDLGADLCVPEQADDDQDKDAAPRLRISAGQVERLEKNIDQLNADLEPLRSFILPGGSLAGAALHMARTISRRAERDMITLVQKEGEYVSADALRYINRLSDFLFVASRSANDQGKRDVLWQPGKNQ